MAFTQPLCDSGGVKKGHPHTLTPYPLKGCAQGCWYNRTQESVLAIQAAHTPILRCIFCPWAPMEPSPCSRLSPPNQKSGFEGVILFCAHTALLSLMEERLGCLCTCTLSDGMQEECCAPLVKPIP